MAQKAETRCFHCSLSIATFSSSFRTSAVFVSTSIVLLQDSRGRPPFLLPLSGVHLNYVVQIKFWRKQLWKTYVWILNSLKTNVVISQLTPFIYSNVSGNLWICEKVFRHQTGQSMRASNDRLILLLIISNLKRKWHQSVKLIASRSTYAQ